MRRHESHLKTLGHPYTDEEIKLTPQAVTAKTRTEMDALIAYLQGLGTALKIKAN